MVEDVHQLDDIPNGLRDLYNESIPLLRAGCDRRELRQRLLLRQPFVSRVQHSARRYDAAELLHDHGGHLFNVFGTCSPAPAPCEILTVSGLPGTGTRLMGRMQISGGNCATSGAGTATGAEVAMTNASTTQITYSLASNPGTCNSGSVLWPDVRQFDERVYTSDAASITHIIIIPMENRSQDEVFRDFPGVTAKCVGGSNAGTACIAPNDATSRCTGGGTCPYITTGQASTGTVTLQPESPSQLFPTDLPHSHEASVWSIDGGLMDKFDTAPLNAGSLQTCSSGPYLGQCCGGNCTNSLPGGSCSPGSCGTSTPAPYLYLPASQISYTRLLASTYGIGDNMFATNSGPSNPTHFWMWAAQAFEMANNNLLTVLQLPSGNPPWASHWTCDSLHTGTNSPTGPPLVYTGTEINERLSDGTFYFAGTCNNALTTACTCKCATGTSCFQNEVVGYTTGAAGECTVGGATCHVDNDCSGGANGPCVLNSPSWAACSDTSECGAGNTCDTHHSLSGSAGAPCPSVTTLGAQMDAAGVSWRYYTNPNGLWNPLTYSRTDRYGTDFTNNVFNDECGLAGEPTCVSNSNTLGDFALDAAACTALSCKIGSVTWVSPGTISNSQHPFIGTFSTGESWYQRQIQAA